MNIDAMDCFKEVLVGAMTIQTYTADVPQFQTYFESLTPENVSNPWFPLLPRGSHYCPVVPTAASWFPLLSRGSHCCLVVPTAVVRTVLLYVE